MPWEPPPEPLPPPPPSGSDGFWDLPQPGPAAPPPSTPTGGLPSPGSPTEGIPGELQTPWFDREHVPDTAQESGLPFWSQENISGIIGDYQAAVPDSVDTVGIDPGDEQDVGGGALGESTELESVYDPIRQQLQQRGQGGQNVHSLIRQNQGQMGAGNTQMQAYQQFQDQIGQDPGLGAYYDRAAERFGTGMNAQLAARGAYGSSRGLGQLSEGLSGLEAQRANREADYMLGQQQLGAQMANAAGTSQAQWARGLGNLGLGADQGDMGRHQMALQGAQAIDRSTLDRQSMAFNQMMGLTGMTMPKFDQIYQDEIQGDLDLFQGVTGGNIASGQAGLSEAEANSADVDDNISNKMEVAAGVMTMGGSVAAGGVTDSIGGNSGGGFGI